MSIPIDPEGYSINVDTGTIHTRYATHAGLFTRTRTVKGATYLLDGKDANPCSVCYPSPQYDLPPTPKKPQVRRKPKANA